MFEGCNKRYENTKKLKFFEIYYDRKELIFKTAMGKVGSMPTFAKIQERKAKSLLEQKLKQGFVEVGDCTCFKVYRTKTKTKTKTLPQFVGGRKFT